MTFEWDDGKAHANLNKHGVSFEEAAEVFRDPLYLVFSDPAHSIDEQRFILLGESGKGRLLVVSYADRNDAIRLISAREATRTERKNYEQDL